MSDATAEQRAAVTKAVDTIAVIIDRAMGILLLGASVTIFSGHATELSVLGAALYLGSFLRSRN